MLQKYKTSMFNHLAKRGISSMINNRSTPLSFIKKSTKNITLSTRLLTQIPRFSFALQQRGYRENTDFDWNVATFMQQFVHGACNTQDIIKVFRDYQDKLTDKHMAFLITRIAQNDLDKSKEFYDFVMPIVIDQIKYLDRQCTRSLYFFSKSFAKMNIHDNRLWEILQDKILGERLWRYYKVQDLGHIVESWVEAGRASPELLDIYQRRLYKHRRSLQEQDIQVAKRVLQATSRDSPEFIDALQNLQVEIPALQ